MLEDLSLPVKIWTCRVRTVKESLNKVDQDILEQAITNPDWPYRTLSNELRKREITISDTVIKQHREKRCSCWKD
jgi:hypothetical protein